MSELSELYPVLASVAAITTAIQTPLALSAYQTCSKLVVPLGPGFIGERKHGEAEAERGSLALGIALLNFPATIVNAFVIIPWSYLIYHQGMLAQNWLYFLPWFGVAFAAFFLFLLVVASIAALWTRWLPAVVVTTFFGVLTISGLVIGLGLPV